MNDYGKYHKERLQQVIAAFIVLQPEYSIGLHDKERAVHSGI